MVPICHYVAIENTITQCETNPIMSLKQILPFISRCLLTCLGRINRDIPDAGYEFTVFRVDALRVGPLVKQPVQLANLPPVIVDKILHQVRVADFILRFG